MAYIKNNWVDREGTTRYFETVDDDGALIFTPDYTQVTELGTPVNADNMNHIEEGIAAGSFTKYDTKATYAKNDLVTTIVDNELKVYKSLQDNNTNALDNASFWEEVKFSGDGGTGLQMFDTILKDRILTYEETKGLALQGSYVYKEAIAGSRYGYPDFYNKVIEEFNQATTTETVNGVTVKVHSNGHKFYDIANKTGIDEFFNTMGTAWFYGVDTENERIFLPRDKYFAVKGDVSVAGNGLALGITDGTNTGVWGSYGTDTISANTFLGTSVGTAVGTGYARANNNAIGIISDSTKSGIEGKLSSNTDKYLYICVGNTTNYEGVSEVVNQGMEILEQINAGFVQKESMREVPCIVETYVNGTSWYRVWSDGWCEQGGQTGSGTSGTISLLKTYINTNYMCNLQELVHSAAYYNGTTITRSISSIQWDISGQNANSYVWETKGYIA